MWVDVVQIGGETDAGLAAFLRERAASAWRREGAQRALRVELRAAPSGRVDVVVLEESDVWAQRTFDGAGGTTAARVAVWLFVRSTIARAAADRPPSPAAPADSAAVLPVDDALAAGAPPPRAAAPQIPSGEAPAPVTTAPEHTSVPGSGGVADPPDTDATAAAPPVPRRRVVSAGLAATCTAGTDRLWSFGLSGTSILRLGRLAVAWAELGYAVSPGSRGLRLHRLPVALALGVRPRRLGALELGLTAVGEGRLAIAGRHQRYGIGLAVGPAARWTWPAVAGRAAFIRAGWLWGVRRYRYLFDGGESAEAPWAFALAAGVALP